MSERSRDELAAALAGLHSGELPDAPPESSPPADGSDAAPPPAPPTVRPSAPSRPATPAGGVPPRRPPTPSGVPGRPHPQPNVPVRPAGGIRPAASSRPLGVRSPPPDSDSLTPLAGTSTSIPPPSRGQAPRQAAAVSRDLPFYRRLSYRRTFIPVLLTGGTCLIAFGAAKWVCDPETILAQLPRWSAVGLLVTGGLSVLLGVVTMSQVRRDLRTEGGTDPLKTLEAK